MHVGTYLSVSNESGKIERVGLVGRAAFMHLDVSVKSKIRDKEVQIWKVLVFQTILYLSS